MSTGIPIACTLAPRGLIDRAAWIKRLNEASLRGYRREGSTLDLTYAPEALDRVRDLAEWERKCCPFLRFTVEERMEAVGLRIAAPPEAGGAAGVLLAYFVAGARPGAGVDTESLNRVAGTTCACPHAPSPAAPEARRGPADALGRAAARAAVTSAGVALVCGVCCLVPLAVPAVAVTGLGGALALFAGAFPWARAAAVILVDAGWLWLGWRSLRLRSRPSAAVLSAMVVSTVVLGVALKWPLLERQIMQVLRGG